MRAILFTFALVFTLQFARGQSLQKDNLFGVHLIEVKLNSGVTMEDFKTFFVKEVLPEYEKHWIGLKGHLVKSVRGENQNKFAIVWVFANEPTRDYYFNKDGTPNDFELEAFEKVKPIEEKLKQRYGTYTVKYMDDWVVE